MKVGLGVVSGSLCSAESRRKKSCAERSDVNARPSGRGARRGRPGGAPRCRWRRTPGSSAPRRTSASATGRRRCRRRPGGRPRRASGCAPETDFRHAGLASTRPYDMNAALMRLERHERGIHAFRSGPAARITRHDSVPGTRQHHGPAPGHAPAAHGRPQLGSAFLVHDAVAEMDHAAGKPVAPAGAWTPAAGPARAGRGRPRSMIPAGPGRLTHRTEQAKERPRCG